jgi:uncharacterized protein (DUF2237 family)
MPFEMDTSINVLGQALQSCSRDPMTGFFRNGSCDTCAEDRGIHTVCAVMTEEFLAFSKYVGNDLSTPRPEYSFAGLKQAINGASARRGSCRPMTKASPRA